ncbi:unnamed protein product [Clavelina lepadiformis]|uniref:Uncharacterized protein n=1 Tax=Clavelina lepadiformis TaxID=159417 RepID=A0ABP0GL64_CLALP
MVFRLLLMLAFLLIVGLAVTKDSLLCIWFDTSSREIGVYKNGLDADTAVYNGDHVPGGGIFIMGQDQDSFGGTFQGFQAFR